MAIREVIKDELENSLRMEKDYVRVLEQLPRGNLIKKKIKGNEYWYMQIRDGQKVRLDYVKKPSAAMIRKYQKAKEDRARYRSLLSQVRKQIRQLERMLRMASSV